MMTVSIDAETQRGLIQGILSITMTVWGTSMWHKGIVRRERWWPLPWNGLIGPFLLTLGIWFGLHAFYWLDIAAPASPNHWAFLVTGWVAATLSIWSMFRWMQTPDRDTEQDDRDVEQDARDATQQQREDDFAEGEMAP
jgi:hypothetical protein